MSDENKTPANDRDKQDFPGYPHYPANQDIYGKEKHEGNISLEDLSSPKSPNADPDAMNEKAFRDDVSGNDLDVPGSELDDDMEEIGEEDEENNYYSLGGDNHEDLEEDKGDMETP